MENSNTLLNSPASQARKRKGRNSAIRKEQNRVASRAYREKRKQKLALLDEILRSDTHTDSMSSVSDETECGPTTPPLEARVLEYTAGIRNSSTSPLQTYTCAVPGLGLMTSNHQPLLSNGPNRSTEACVDYPLNSYIQEAGRLPQHNEYPHDPNFVGLGIHTSPVPTLCSISSMSSSVSPLPMFNFDDEAIGDSFGDYPLSNGCMTDIPVGTEFDMNMLKALEALSTLNDNQLQHVVSYIQKKRNSVHMAHSELDLNHINCTYHAPRVSQTPGYL